MSNDDEPPAWLPDALKPHWDEGELRPPRQGRYDLGEVPEGTDLTVRAPSGGISLGATSVGAESRLLLIGEIRHQVVVDGFEDIRLCETLPQTLVLSGDANVHVETGGKLVLGVLDSEDEEKPTARVSFDDDSESPGTCALTTAVPLKGISGASSAAVDLRAQGNVEGRPVAAGALVQLPNCRSLTVQGQLEDNEVELAGGLTVTGGLAGSCKVTAGAVLVGPNAASSTWRPTDDAMAGAGTTVRATTGKIAIGGRIDGSEKSPVILTGANEKDVQIGAAEHTTVQAAEGQQLGAVTVGPSSHVKITGATSIGDYGADTESHVAPTMDATTRIGLAGLVLGGSLQAETVRVRDVVGPATLKGSTVGLGTSAHEDSGSVTIEATQWVRAPSAADLHVTARGEAPCRLLLGQEHGNPSHQNRPLDPPPADLLEEGVPELRPDNGQTARLDLHGRLQVECSAATTVVRTAGDLTSLRTAGELLMLAGGSVGQVRSAGELRLGGGGTRPVVLEASDVKAPAIAQSNEEEAAGVTLNASGTVRTGTVSLEKLSCASLYVEGDATLGALRVTKTTSITGRLSAPEAPVEDGEHRLSGTVELADVDVALILDEAEGSIKASECDDAEQGEGSVAPVIAELHWQKPTGSLHLEHEVSVLKASSHEKQGLLGVPIPSRCERLEVDGKVLIRSPAGTRASGKAAHADVESDEIERPRIVLSDGAKLTLALAHPVWIDLDSAASAKVRVEDRQAVLHLLQEATSGRLALSVPRKDAEGNHMARLVSSATGAEVPSQPVIVIAQGDLLLSGAFAEVLALDSASRHGPSAAPTTVHVPAETVVHQMRGVVALGGFHGRVTGAEAGHGKLHRFTAQDGPHWWWTRWLRKVLGDLTPGPSDEDRLVLVDPAAPDGQDASISTGVLVGADVTRLSFAELDRLKGLDVFSPDPVALERKARERALRAAARQSNAQRLSHIAQLVEGRSVTGSVRSMANWAASTAHAATGRGLERVGRRAARTLGYGQRPMPALALLVALVVLTTSVLTKTGLEAAVCDGWFNNTEGAAAVAGYTWIEHLERVLLAPLAFLRVAGQADGLAALGCNPLLQVVGTVLIALPLAFVLIGLRNYLRSPIDR